MSPPVLLRMYEITHDKKYLDYMDHEWWLTSDSLYNKDNHLYFRDSRYFTQKQANGKPIFWSRGNGWVMGALVNVLQIMPKDYPSRPKYVAQFKEMAAEIASIQSADGLWRSGLLDPDAYDLPEVSGSAFFTFGIAYGINEKILDRKTYLPVVEKSWKGMLGAHLCGWTAGFDSADRCAAGEVQAIGQLCVRRGRLSSGGVGDASACRALGFLPPMVFTIHSNGWRTGKLRMTSGTVGSGFSVFHRAM